RFLPTVCDSSGATFLCYAGQVQYPIQTALLASRGSTQDLGAVRPNWCAHYFYSAKDYPQALRRVFVKDETGKRITFLTNNFALKPELIADLYRQRWQVELFFKWIKQHLRIKTFLGTTENAVKTQIWIAVCTYVLIAILKKRLNLPNSLHEILQILSLTMFETTPINQLLEKHEPDDEPEFEPTQLALL